MLIASFIPYWFQSSAGGLKSKYEKEGLCPA